MNNYLQYVNISSNRLENILKTQNKSDHEIKEVVNKISNSKEKINKVLKKYYTSLIHKYPGAEPHELMNHALKYADKYGITSQEEKNLLFKMISKNHTQLKNPYFSPNEVFSKFFDIKQEKLLKISDNEKPLIEHFDNLFSKFGTVDKLYGKSRDMSLTCQENKIPPQITSAQFTLNFNDPNFYVHPVLFCLYAAKINYIDNITLWSNIGRFVLNRIPHVKAKYIDPIMTSGYELAQDELLISQISADPAADDYFNDEKISPIENLYLRYKIQIAVWENILKLRNGNLYLNVFEIMRQENLSLYKLFSGTNYIQNLLDEFDKFNLTYFDNPELVSIRNEGTFLKKFLAVFSIRPSVFSSSDKPFTYGATLHPSQVIPPTYYISPVCVLPFVSKTTGKGSYTLMELINSNQYLYLKKQLTIVNRNFEYGSDVFFVIINRDAEINNFQFNGMTLNGPQKDIQYNKPVLNEVPIQVTNLYFKNTKYFIHAFTYVNADFITSAICLKTSFEPSQIFNATKPAISIITDMNKYETLLNTRSTILIFTTTQTNILI
jgi:hypothetical protein